jgi:predicted XRE-type DNA-binding protein
MIKKDITFEESSGNVFADLGIDMPEEMLAKSRIAYLIVQIISKSHMTQQEAAKVLGLTQPKVSLIMNGRLEGFSLERLIMAMTALDRDVEIRIRKKPRSREHAHLNVVYA